MTTPSSQTIRKAVQAALAEDLGQGDATTAALFPKPVPARGTIVAHEAMTVAGVAAARQTFLAVDRLVKVVRTVRDGLTIERESPVLIVEGDARSLLMAERVSLNFLQHLSGIATLTGRFCQAVRGYRVKILDTRKTTPGLRALEKWAVRLGGGRNHRHSLSDGILIKDNHLALTGQSVQQALSTKAFGRTLHLLEGTSSTNTVAMTLGQEGASHGTVVVAETQTAGRGRSGRQWYSPPGKNLYCSVVLRSMPSPDQLAIWLSWIPLIAGLAAVRAVQTTAALHPSVKWPNDILIGTRKLGGTVCEST